VEARGAVEGDAAEDEEGEAGGAEGYGGGPVELDLREAGGGAEVDILIERPWKKYATKLRAGS
jgi:hypothetical protein